MSMRATVHGRGPLGSSCGFFSGDDKFGMDKSCLGRRTSFGGRALGALRRNGSMVAAECQLPGTPPAHPALAKTASEPFLGHGSDGNIRPSASSRPRTRKLFITEANAGRPACADDRSDSPPRRTPEQSPEPGAPGATQDLEQSSCRPSTPTRPVTPLDEPCGLTPASLKHLRRQCNALTDDKERLLAEIARLQALLREQRDRNAELEAAAAASATPEPVDKDTAENSARDEKEDTWAALEAELRAKLASVEGEQALLDRTLTRREAEIERLKDSLQEQMACTQEQCDSKERALEAAERAKARAKDLADRVRLLEEEMIKLNSIKCQLEDQKGELSQQVARTNREAEDAAAMAAAKVESVTKMHEEYRNESEKLRAGLIGTAIQSKLELHISVPHVVLTYNNAPPLTVSTSVGLSKAKILKFLENVLFPYFEPLWVCLDGVDKAPDGTNKKRYSGRMLERLTESIKDFIEKSQLGEPAELGAVTSSSTTEARASSHRASSKGSSNSNFKVLGSLRTPSR